MSVQRPDRAPAPTPTPVPHGTPAAVGAQGSGARPSWHTYFLDFARLAAQRATCLRRQVGAVIVKNNMVLTTGYNGAPRGMPHAAEVGCLRNQLNVPSGERHELCRGLHAEQNAIIQAARHGVSIEGGELYCTHHPCAICLKMILNAGILRVFFAEGYPDALATRIIAESGFEVVPLGAPVARPRLPILSG